MPKGFKFELTDNVISQIEKMSSLGLNDKEIACLIGLADRTWRRKKKENEKVKAAIEIGKAKGKLKSSMSLMRNVEAGDMKAIIYYEESRHKMRTTTPDPCNDNNDDAVTSISATIKKE